MGKMMTCFLMTLFFSSISLCLSSDYFKVKKQVSKKKNMKVVICLKSERIPQKKVMMISDHGSDSGVVVFLLFEFHYYHYKCLNNKSW